MEHSNTIAYKTWFENLNEPAPEEAWNAIADQLDIDAAWDTISETLDLDDVWNNMEADLPQGITGSAPASPKYLPKLFWAAAVLILLTLTTPLADKHQVEPGLSKQKNNAVAEQEIVKAPESNLSLKKTEDVAQKQPVPQRKLVSKTTTPDSHQHAAGTESQQLALTFAPKATQDFSNEVQLAHDSAGVSNLVAKMPPDNITLLKTDSVGAIKEADSVSVIAKNQTEVKDSVQREQPKRANWQVGVIGSVKNTWLINPETTNGLKRSALNDTRLTFGKEFGITVQRSVGGQSALQIEYYFYSEIGQRYHEYINALYQTKDIQLRYQKVQLVYRTRIFRKFEAPNLYAIGGIRVSRLTLADASIGGEDQIVTQEYRPWDYGFILGAEAEFELTNKLLLVSGLRASYGIRNIYLGNSNVPEEFNKTHTASVGLLFGIKYRIN